MNRIEILKEYLKEDPADPFTRYALALEYISSGENDNAMQLLSDLIIDSPDYLPAYYQLGKAYEGKGRTQQAADIYSMGMSVAKIQRNQHTFNELQNALEDIG
jgi:tetratricopeptide (TPR) repeat protein